MARRATIRLVLNSQFSPSDQDFTLQGLTVPVIRVRLMVVTGVASRNHIITFGTLSRKRQMAEQVRLFLLQLSG